jgi:hypothetical protein
MSIVIHACLIVFYVITEKGLSGSEKFNTVSVNVELLLWGLLTLVLCYLPDIIDRNLKIHLPVAFEAVIVLFIYCSTFLSVRFDLYYKLFWWDDLLHMISGIIIGFIGAMCVYIINKKYSTNLNPVLVAVFAFTFAVSMGVLWEVFEFTLDAVFGTANQKWDLPATAVLLGKSYQGSGLRDTMSDLIVDCIGAMLSSFCSYFIVKRDKKRTLKVMKKIFPE